MKRFFILVSVVLCVLLASCNTASKVKNDAFPASYETLEFWNGGGCMAKYADVSMEVTMMQSSTLTNAISFYKYHVFNRKQGIDEYIIDSEALSIKFTLPENEE